jgi:hypothetical protein
MGHRLASSIIKAKLMRALLILTNGPDKSGKSLPPLAMDEIFCPEHNQNGIENYFITHTRLDPEFAYWRKLPVVFKNFGNLVMSSQSDFDEFLSDYRHRNPQARILTASNLHRTPHGDYDYEKNGLSSMQLDLHLQYHTLPGTFSRRISATFDNPIFLPIFAPSFQNIIPKGSRNLSCPGNETSGPV